MCVTAIHACIQSNETCADVMVTVGGRGREGGGGSPYLSVFTDTFHVSTFPPFPGTMCCAVNRWHRWLSISAHLPPPRTPPSQNAGAFLVRVGRFNKLPCHPDYTQTHNTLPAMNHDRILSEKSRQVFVAYCHLLTLSCAFPHSSLCLQRQWPLTSHDPPTYPTTNAHSLRQEAETLTELF